MNKLLVIISIVLGTFCSFAQTPDVIWSKEVKVHKKTKFASLIAKDADSYYVIEYGGGKSAEFWLLRYSLKHELIYAKQLEISYNNAVVIENKLVLFELKAVNKQNKMVIIAWEIGNDGTVESTREVCSFSNHNPRASRIAISYSPNKKAILISNFKREGDNAGNCASVEVKVLDNKLNQILDNEIAIPNPSNVSKDFYGVHDKLSVTDNGDVVLMIEYDYHKAVSKHSLFTLSAQSGKIMQAALEIPADIFLSDIIFRVWSGKVIVLALNIAVKSQSVFCWNYNVEDLKLNSFKQHDFGDKIDTKSTDVIYESYNSFKNYVFRELHIGVDGSMEIIAEDYKRHVSYSKEGTSVTYYHNEIMVCNFDADFKLTDLKFSYKNQWSKYGAYSSFFYVKENGQYYFVFNEYVKATVRNSRGKLVYRSSFTEGYSKNELVVSRPNAYSNIEREKLQLPVKFKLPIIPNASLSGGSGNTIVFAHNKGVYRVGVVSIK
jgi:hypothetical protein